MLEKRNSDEPECKSAGDSGDCVDDVVSAATDAFMRKALDVARRASEYAARFSKEKMS